LGTYLGKTAPDIPPVPWNSLFPEDSTSTDSDEDLAEELDEFFRFKIWNDLSEEEEEEDSSFFETEEFPCNSTSSWSLSSAIVVVASSFVVIRLLSDNHHCLCNWFFIYLKPGYSAIPSRI